MTWITLRLRWESGKPFTARFGVTPSGAVYVRSKRGPLLRVNEPEIVEAVRQAVNNRAPVCLREEAGG